MLIESLTIADAWERSIIALLSRYSHNSSDLLPTERGSNSIEIQNLQLQIESPMQEKRLSNLSQCTEYVEQYSRQLLDQSYLNQVYSRITQLSANNSEILNQQEEIVLKLHDEWYTRRAVISTWMPLQDIGSEHPPCICLLQYYIREESLCLTSFLRSNDAWLCAPVDMIALTNMQRTVADALSIKVGTYCHFAVSYHIYDPPISSPDRLPSLCHGNPYVQEQKKGALVQIEIILSMG